MIYIKGETGVCGKGKRGGLVNEGVMPKKSEEWGNAGYVIEWIEKTHARGGKATILIFRTTFIIYTRWRNFRLTG